MTGVLLLSALLIVETPRPTPPPAATVSSVSPLRASIVRAASSVTLTEPAPPTPAAAATGAPRCSKKAGAIVGAVVGGVALAVIAQQSYEPNFIFTKSQETWIGGAIGAGVGALLGYGACRG